MTTSSTNPPTGSIKLHDPSQLSARNKVEILVESLLWLQQFRGRVIVIKFGGNAMIDEQLFNDFATDLAYLKATGIYPVVVHGGGPQISAALKERGIASEFRSGYRYTSAEAISVVAEVLNGEVQLSLVDAINLNGDLAIGVNASGLNLLSAEPLLVTAEDGTPVDLGQVGSVTGVDSEALQRLLDEEKIPVISSVALDAQGVPMNVNADDAAAAVAVAMQADKLMVLTDVAGLYGDWPNKDSLISSIDSESLKELLPSLESGMIPKMKACLTAVEGGVAKAAIIDGREPHAVLLEIFTTSGFGTEVVPAGEE